MADRKIFPSIDLAKFIMAMLILTQHTSNEWAHSTGLVHAFFGLGNFAVPFFFACSGFLFFSKCDNLPREEQTGYYKKWSVRLCKMYLVWTLIYFCFVFYGWLQDGLTWAAIQKYLHHALVYSTYPTIWFLPALWVGVSICYWMKRYLSIKMMLPVMLLLMIVGNLFGSYNTVLTQVAPIAHFYEWYMDVFITWRNGIFNGAPYVFIGLVLAKNGVSHTPPQRTFLWPYIAATAFFCISFLAEAFVISRYHLSTATDMGFMMAPAIFFMLNMLMRWDVQQRPVWQLCRNLSMLVFLGQRLFLTALPGAFPRMADWINSLPEPCIFLYFVITVLTFSLLIERLSGKFKFLKILW